MVQPGTDHSAGRGEPLGGEARSLLDALPTPSLLLDPQGRVLHANPALEHLAGYPAERLAAQGLDLMLAHRTTALNPAGPASQEFLAARADGTTFWAHLDTARFPAPATASARSSTSRRAARPRGRSPSPASARHWGC